MNASYLIYDVREIGEHKLLKLRNPPDYGEGKGEWECLEEWPWAGDAIVYAAR